MSAHVIQAKYDQLDAVARQFAQQAQAISELRTRLHRAAQPLEAGGWQGRGAAAFFGELNAEVVPATQRLRQALDAASAVTLEIRALLQQAEHEAAAPFRGRAAGSTNGAAANGPTAAAAPPDASGPSGALIAAGLAADLTPVVGELKGLAEIFTGTDLVTGEELGWWRFAGILGLVGFNEVKLLRHADDVVDAASDLARHGDEVVRPFDIVPYRPSVPNLELHHGVLDTWAKHNIPGYVSRGTDNPVIALTTAQHEPTKAVYRAWLREKTGKPVGGKVDWANVSPREMQELTERMFDAAGIPAGARTLYYRALHHYIYRGD